MGAKTARLEQRKALKVREGVPLDRRTSLRVGGRAAFFVEPEAPGDLAEVLSMATHLNMPVRFLGGGTNLLVASPVVGGLVVSTRGLSWVERRANRVRCGAGTPLLSLIRKTLEWRLGGLETLAGIPGTVGGAVAGNAGGRFGDTFDRLESVVLADRTGKIEEVAAGQIAGGYRCTRLGGRAVVEATFRLEPDREGTRRYWQILRKKLQSQPYHLPSAGCVFRNPDCESAGRLLDAAGLKGARIGDAEISTLHANFVVNRGAARGDEVLDLILRAAWKVRDRFGVHLEREVILW